MCVVFKRLLISLIGNNGKEVIVIKRFVMLTEEKEKASDRLKILKNKRSRIGSLEGRNLIDPNYDIDECNDEIAEMFENNEAADYSCEKLVTHV